MPRAQPQGVGDQLRPQLADHVGGRAVGGHLAEPRERRAAGDDDEQRHQHRGQRDQRLATEEGAGDSARQQLGLHEHQTRGQHGGRGGEDHEPPCGRCVPQQPRVQWLHRACAPASVAESTTDAVAGPVVAVGNPVGAGMSVGLMRRRKTQNVHVW